MKFRIKHILYYLMICVGVALIVHGLMTFTNWSFDIAGLGRYSPSSTNSGFAAFLTFFGGGVGCILYGLFEVQGTRGLTEDESDSNS